MTTIKTLEKYGFSYLEIYFSLNNVVQSLQMILQKKSYKKFAVIAKEIVDTIEYTGDYSVTNKVKMKIETHILSSNKVQAKKQLAQLLEDTLLTTYHPQTGFCTRYFKIGE